MTEIVSTGNHCGYLAVKQIRLCICPFMKESRYPIRPRLSPVCIIGLLIAGSALLTGCGVIPGHGFSEVRRSRTAGDNLGFEILEKGKPVNWFFKTERVINSMSVHGDVVEFECMVDTLDFKEGKRSLRYDLRRCSSNRENMRLYAYYPGFFNEFDAEPGATYRVGFWIKNQGCEFTVRTSAVRAYGGGPCENHSFHADVDIPEWTHYSLDQTVCPTMDYLRIELDILSVGTFRIDGLTIEKLSGYPSIPTNTHSSNH